MLHRQLTTSDYFTKDELAWHCSKVPDKAAVKEFPSSVAKIDEQTSSSDNDDSYWPFAWGVKFVYNGRNERSVHKDRAAAEAYAARYHGVVVPLGEIQ